MSAAPALLVFRVEAALAGLPVEHVVETMRPLALLPVASAPAYVAGAAVVRGEAVPVIDLARLLSSASSAPAARWISLRAGTRSAVLAVGEILGVRRAGATRASALVSGVATSVLDSIGVLDAELLVVLAAARVVTAEAWQAFDAVTA